MNLYTVKVLLISLFMLLIAKLAFCADLTDQMERGTTFQELSQIFKDNGIISFVKYYYVCYNEFKSGAGLTYDHRYIICVSGFDTNFYITGIYDQNSGTFIK